MLASEMTAAGAETGLCKQAHVPGRPAMPPAQLQLHRSTPAAVLQHQSSCTLTRSGAHSRAGCRCLHAPQVLLPLAIPLSRVLHVGLDPVADELHQGQGLPEAHRLRALQGRTPHHQAR